MQMNDYFNENVETKMTATSSPGVVTNAVASVEKPQSISSNSESL
jgi:hypothetical protein